ncbi:hypothetical protein [Phenylobacterium sp.]|jgi:hypothetical protein|uniref:hypothetical protein n=1 Tax=Phenylobacterium sp. TaxID=1871053 RepID=UPI002F930B0E
MDVERLSPASRDLLLQALPAGEVVNVLYKDGARVELGFARDRRCFALGERGWLSFKGWEGEPSQGAACASRWALTVQALEVLAGRREAEAA